MTSTRVYDWPTRVFHWVFAAAFVTAFTIANVVDDEAAAFSFHMLAGLVLGAAIVLRLVWSVVGTRHARLTDLSLSPARLFAYVRGVLSGRGETNAGHNPASSWAAVAMVLLGIGLVVTGVMMATGTGGEAPEEVHELFADAFLVVVLVHIAGVVLHGLQRRDGLAASMVTGRKALGDAAHADVRAHAAVGVLFVALLGGWLATLLVNHDAQARTLTLFGQTLQLGEAEEGEGGGAAEGGEAHGEHDDEAHDE